MKAAVRSTYGFTEVLSIKDLPVPAPMDNEVLIRVHAATVNRTDCHVLTGKPFVMRLFTGLTRPKLAITGSDFAGEIEKTGKKVSNYTAGDRVMGFGGVYGCGSHAQYLAFPAESGIVKIPGQISYAEAAACLEGAIYAHPVTYFNPGEGKKALIFGAGGAIGSAMVQFLKYYKVQVTAVCRKDQFPLMQSLGADKLIDYSTEDFTKEKGEYDCVFDAVGKSSFYKCKHLLRKNGIYTSSGGLENLLPTIITPLIGGRKAVFKMPRFQPALSFVQDLLERGIFKPVIDRIYTFDQIREAFEYVASGQKTGNVVLTMPV